MSVNFFFEEPPAGLIDSMCLRYDHTFGIKSAPEISPKFMIKGWTEEERDTLRIKMIRAYDLMREHSSLDNILKSELKEKFNFDDVTIEQLYEEASGNGFYKFNILMNVPAKDMIITSSTKSPPETNIIKNEDTELLNWLEKAAWKHDLEAHYDEGDPEVGLFPHWTIDHFIGYTPTPTWETVGCENTLRDVIKSVKDKYN